MRAPDESGTSDETHAGHECGGGAKHVQRDRAEVLDGAAGGSRESSTSGPSAVCGYEITIRVQDKELASQVVTNLVRSDCYEGVDTLRVAAIPAGDGIEAPDPGGPSRPS